MGSTRTAAFHTLGCKLNFAETSTLARSLEEAGYARVKVEERPDVFVLNTCSVTENADKECRQWVRRFQRINPEAFIAVVGCYAQLKPQEIAAIPGVGLVLGANEKFDLAEYLPQPQPLSQGEGNSIGTTYDPDQRFMTLSMGEGRVRAAPIKDLKHFVPSWNSGDRTRTFLKVQDGCDYFCSFCTIPLARGRSRSATIAETVAIAEGIAASGVKEIVLTGVNTGDFGRAHGESFLELAQALDHVEGIERFRISSIEPNLCSDAVIDFVAGSRRFMPHFHMPLQSGSDVILERMRRRYDTTLYADRVAHIKRVMPHACIGVDVITGTPGETDEEFLKTRGFLRSIPVDYLHAFTYSERANTTAVRMDDAVPMETRRERTKQLRILSSKLQRAHYERHLDTARPVLLEAEEVDGMMRGYTDNYIRVELPYDPTLVNSVRPAVLQRINGNGLMDAAIAIDQLIDQMTS
ncbi:MAG: tRNA (N(6)-L-threonylcarbamoyladenosine(37)-C(2))-methylthiotransferase MtaB [Flavobacteriales bacterium]